MADDFGIGVSEGGITLLSDLATPVSNPHSDYFPYSGQDELQDGTVRGKGWPLAVWDHGIAPLEEREMLKTFCPGKSAEVYISTKMPDGTFGEFAAVMIWPDDRWWYSLRSGLVIAFQRLVAVGS